MLMLLVLAISLASATVLVRHARAEHRARQAAVLRSPRTTAQLHHSCPLV